MKKAQEMFDKIPELIEKKKVGGKDLPTEVLIKKKRKLTSSDWLKDAKHAYLVIFYNAKANRRGEDKAKLVECIKISPAEELGICKSSLSILTERT